MGHSGLVLLFLIGNRVGNLVQAGISNKKKISYTASVLPVEQLATAAARRGEACHRSILFRNFLLQDGSYTSYVYIISTRPQQLEQSISIDSDCSSSWSTFPFFWRRRLRPGLVRLSMGLHSSTTNGNLSHDDLLIAWGVFILTTTTAASTMTMAATTTATPHSTTSRVFFSY